MKDKKIKFPKFIKKMHYMKLIKKAKEKYKLEGINDHQLMEALEKTNGNIDEAIIQLIPK